ncbi:A/G-specific adenine glycosylase [Marinifilum sp. RC60d5]|uniref:A/G-specific adenine glycosylase n=1 Tax=Marinifilum sp. RC60d5 TaxID=3458414 RepID=UPI0040352F75
MLNNQIINWYSKNKRDLPWRKTKDPYLIWISEIMLQQTRVATAIDYYNRFIERFPTLSCLAKAKEQEVLNLWQGLGYYSRARNLHYAAKTVQQEYDGVFPATYKEIIQLKGIGTYTAAAISSFAFNLPHAVLDGNVFRVLSRLFGIETPIDTTIGKKLFQKLANETLADASPEIYNQAIIEFGALQCTPKSPDCENCPLLANCYAYSNQMIEILPKKSKQIRLKDRYFYYLFLYCPDRFAIEKREGKDIWQNMYQYPLIESATPLKNEQLIESRKWKNYLNDCNAVIKFQSKPIIHKLSHQNIHACFLHIEINKNFSSKNKNVFFIKNEDMDKYPFPKLIENHLSRLK